MLKSSLVSPFIRDALTARARVRREGRRARGRADGNRWFFGEAWVAAHPDFAHRHGWYGSFKWLTAAKWCGAAESLSGPEAEFKIALDTHINNLDDVQRRAGALRKKLKGKRPVAPDLWLVTKRQHRFIEVKLPGDTLKDHQIAGLAFLATCLKADRAVSVEVVRLFDARTSPPVQSDDEQSGFAKWCTVLREGATARSRK